ncbi:hypothetical protein PPNSA23_12760 [Phyllobacterium phragmitis]|uniref:Uncharacterized protein n=1 Tax=Phyllobacterium phragmitis TaxID=2670329 RepID=A0ABQ0GXE9_9HYPH
MGRALAACGTSLALAAWTGQVQKGRLPPGDTEAASYSGIQKIEGLWRVAERDRNTRRSLWETTIMSAKRWKTSIALDPASGYKAAHRVISCV